ncbi:MAG: DEAD/DEAH box helicase, partial [Bacillati bacterium]
SCGTCHQYTINEGWCAGCIDVPSNKYTCNPVQADVYKALEENPRQSLIVASKTGTGKTWCAYEAIRKYYESDGSGKVFWLNPLKQIVREKVEELEATFTEKKILELTGDTSNEVGYGNARNDYIKQSDIVVCSYEMFDSLTRKPVLYNAMNDVDFLVIDEIHSIGDYERGGKLDGAITRFLLRAAKNRRKVQIIALSATFENLNDLKKYFDQFTEIKIINSDFTPINVNIDPELYKYTRDANNIFLELVGQYLGKEGGIMCMQLTIPGCKKLAALINSVYGEGIARVHYSELQRDDKYATVDDFNNGKFRVLCCTPTLLAGVNVAATVIILNLSFYNPLKLEPDILPATSIRQAIGRVGRPPRYKEGWVTYLVNERQEDEALAALKQPNIIMGAINSAIHQVFNIEVALQKQLKSELYDWYIHTYSGCSSGTTEILFNEAVSWLIDNGYIIDSNDVLAPTLKGKSCARHYVNPLFYENCLRVLNTTKIETSEQMKLAFEVLFSMPYSPCNWNDRKSDQVDEHFNFRWMINDGTFDWNRIQPSVQWASQIEFALHGIAEVSKELKTEPLAYNSEIIETSMGCGVVPVGMARLRIKLEELGMPYLGHKYLAFLYLNGVQVVDGVLQGPEDFKNVLHATYDKEKYIGVSFDDSPTRYRTAALNLVKKYGMRSVVVDPATDEWA